MYNYRDLRLVELECTENTDRLPGKVRRKFQRSSRVLVVLYLSQGT